MFEKYLTKTGRLSCKQPQDIKNQWYIQKFQEVHEDRYDYINVIYIGQLKKVEIICKEHGSFYQEPQNHLKGVGCPRCQGNKKKTTQQCVEDFKKVHENIFDYSRVQYVNCGTKVEIICKEHGVFSQTPDNHLSGQGCPKCSNHNQNILYILRCLSTGLIKIGITNNLKQRMANMCGSLEHISHIIVDNPRDLERELHKRYQKYNKFNPTVRNGGTEFFQLSEQQVSQLIESLKIA